MIRDMSKYNDIFTSFTDMADFLSHVTIAQLI